MIHLPYLEKMSTIFKSFTSFNWKKNIYAALLLYLLLAMLFYSLCRVGFYVFNISLFGSMAAGTFLQLMQGGLVFDLAAVLYSNILFVLMLIIPHPYRFNKKYKQVAKSVFIIVNALAIATNVIDFIYYKFTLTRTTLSIFSQFQHEENIGKLFSHFLLTYWYAVLLFAVLVWLLKKLYEQIDYEGPQVTNKWSHYIGGIVLVPLFIVVFVGGVRGGFRHSTRPITLSNAAEYSKDPRYANIVLNTPFAIIRTSTTTTIKKVSYFKSEEELSKVFTPLHTPADTAKFRYDNVVILILESFSKEFMGPYNKDMAGNFVSYSPFLD